MPGAQNRGRSRAIKESIIKLRAGQIAFRGLGALVINSSWDRKGQSLLLVIAVIRFRSTDKPLELATASPKDSFDR